MFENKKKVANRCAVHARVYYAKDLWYGSIHKQTVIRVINKQSFTFTKPSWLGSASKK